MRWFRGLHRHSVRALNDTAARERTSLAWNRTVLSYVGCTTLLVRTAWQNGATRASLASLAAGCSAIATFAAYLGYRVHHRNLVADQARTPRTVVAMLAAATLVTMGVAVPALDAGPGHRAEAPAAVPVPGIGGRSHGLAVPGPGSGAARPVGGVPAPGPARRSGHRRSWRAGRSAGPRGYSTMRPLRAHAFKRFDSHLCGSRVAGAVEGRNASAGIRRCGGGRADRRVRVAEAALAGPACRAHGWPSHCPPRGSARGAGIRPATGCRCRRRSGVVRRRIPQRHALSQHPDDNRRDRHHHARPRRSSTGHKTFR